MFRRAFFLAIATLLLSLGVDALQSAIPQYDAIFVGLGLTSSVTLPSLAKKLPAMKFAVVEKGGAISAAFGATQPISPAPFADADATLSDIPGFYDAMAFHPAFDATYSDPTVPWTFQGMGFGGNAAYNGAWVQVPTKENLSGKNGWPEGWQYDELKAAIDKVLASTQGSCKLSSTPSANNQSYNQAAFVPLQRTMHATGTPESSIVDMEDCGNKRNQVSPCYGRPAVSATSKGIRCFPGAGPLSALINKDGRSILPNVDIYSYSEATKIVMDPSANVPTAVEVTSQTKKNLTLPLTANGRVIAAAGALQTPALLQRSGIAPDGPIVENAAVGKNLSVAMLRVGAHTHSAFTRCS